MRALLLVLTLCLAACQSVPHNEGDPAKVSDVVSQIKADLGVYQQYDADAAAAKPRDNVCQGSVRFDIDNVKVSLTTQTDDTATVTGSATLPVGSGTFLPSLGLTREVKGTQTLTFSFYPKPVVINNPKPASAPAQIDANAYPIAASLQRLRDGLLEASQKTPCISLVPLGVGPDGKPATDPGGTFAFGFTVTNTHSTGGTLKFVIFSLGATNSAQAQAANTITVTFKARPGSAAVK